MTSTPRGLGSLSPNEEALAWWHARIDSSIYVGLPDDLPSSAAVQVLETRGLIARPRGDWAFVVCTPNTDRESALRANYWKFVEVALARYGPAAIDRSAALRLYTGDESIRPQVDLRHTASRSNWTREILPGAALVLRAADMQPDQPPAPLVTRTLEVSGATLVVVSPETLLLALTVGDVRAGMALVVPWLRTLIVGAQALSDAYEHNPRPTLLKRMGHMALDAGNERLALTIDMLLAGVTRSSIPRGVTGVGTSIIVPRYVTGGKSEREAWLIRYADSFARAAAQLSEQLTPAESRMSAVALDESLAFAREAKREDTYHSTTIEGYQITRAEVDAVVSGRAHDGRTPDEIERLMALRGYSRAFDYILAQVRTVHTAQTSDRPSTRLQVTEGLMLDTFLELWSPSIDAGVMESSDMRSWRLRAVQINGSNYAPPSNAKLGSLMRLVIECTNAITSGALARATFLHWAFVHAHPFMDGNGRVARLLMNAVLCDAGLPWTTIRAEERGLYFAALERAHLDIDLRPLGELMTLAVMRSAEALATWRATPPSNGRTIEHSS